MFGLGVELDAVLKRRALQKSSPLAVGIAAGVPMLITYRMLAPALDLTSRPRVVCYEASVETLASLLHARTIDLAIADSVLAPTSSMRVQSQLIGQCGATFFCARELAEQYRSGFPQSLDRAPFVMPTGASALKASLSEWFRHERIAPSIVAEIASPDLMSALCEADVALFALPTAIAHEVERKYRVSAVGEAPTIEHQFYAAYLERQIGRDSISAIIELARASFRAEAPAVDFVHEQVSTMRTALRTPVDSTSRQRGAAVDPRPEVSAAVYHLADRAKVRQRE
jgi:LysR family transcriptional activator of nhaA